MFDPDVVLEDPLSAMVFGSINMSFVLAHSFANMWVTVHGKNTDLDALKAARQARQGTGQGTGQDAGQEVAQETAEDESDPMSFARAA